MLFLRKRDFTLACDMRRTMKIREIRAVGLRGMTPEGGWNNELRPALSAQDSVIFIFSTAVRAQLHKA